ncbi:MAG: nitroreductase family protein [Andreesenia angusta]|nr:nitroreductase family protein [Andreesenia angusta]
MAIIRFLENRKSVREFRNKKANKKTLEEIKNAVEKIGRESEDKNICFNFYEDGKSIYKKLDGVGGYNGVMIDSPHYVGLEILNDEPRTLLYGSYYMEKLITQLNAIGLDTCWVSVKDADDSLLNTRGGKVDYVLAMGYPKRKLPFTVEPEVERLGLTDIVYKDEVENPIDPEELDNLGISDLFYYLRYAPSSYNTQPWRFLIKDHKVTLLYSHIKGHDIRYVDVGIIMYYFEALAESKGLNSEWTLVDGEIEGEKANYTKIAVFSI